MKYYCVFCAISCYSFNIIYSIDSLEKKKKKKRKTPYISEKNKQKKNALKITLVRPPLVPSAESNDFTRGVKTKNKKVG